MASRSHVTVAVAAFTAGLLCSAIYHQLVMSRQPQVIHQGATPLPATLDTVLKVTHKQLPAVCREDAFLCPGLALPNFDELHLEDIQYLVHRTLIRVSHQCRVRERFGHHGDGSYNLCMEPRATAPAKHSCLVYSFGISYDWSFDDDLQDKWGCEVHSFDPSIGLKDQKHKSNGYFYNLGLWGSNFTNQHGWQLMSLSQIKTKLGHNERVIDVLKVDVEGSEWPFLRHALNDPSALTNVKQLVIELHTPRLRKDREALSVREYVEVYRLLRGLETLSFHAVTTNTWLCCDWFAEFIPEAVAGKPGVCCYEVVYINTNFL